MSKTLTINWREELIKLFPKTTKRTKGGKDDWCSVCNGLGLINKGSHIVGCSACNGKGIIKACECGQAIDRPYYDACTSCCSKKQREQQEQKERERFEAATKVPFEDYSGLFLSDGMVIDKKSLEEELYDLIIGGEDAPTYIWGSQKYKVFSGIDLKEVVYSKCEEGYEDMDGYFDYKDKDFVKAQELLDRWLKKHDAITDIYYDDYKTAVLLDTVIEKTKNQLMEESK